MRCGAARMHDALRNSLVIKVGNLFTEMEVFEQRRSARTSLQGILVVGDDDALVACHGDARLNGVAQELGTFAIVDIARAIVGST